MQCPIIVAVTVLAPFDIRERNFFCTVEQSRSVSARDSFFRQFRKHTDFPFSLRIRPRFGKQLYSLLQVSVLRCLSSDTVKFNVIEQMRRRSSRSVILAAFASSTSSPKRDVRKVIGTSSNKVTFSQDMFLYKHKKAKDFLQTINSYTAIKQICINDIWKQLISQVLLTPPTARCEMPGISLPLTIPDTFSDRHLNHCHFIHIA